MISVTSQTIGQYQSHMSDVFGDISQWQHGINLVTHPVPILPVHGPVIHEAEFQNPAENFAIKLVLQMKQPMASMHNKGQSLFLQSRFSRMSL